MRSIGPICILLLLIFCTACREVNHVSQIPEVVSRPIPKWTLIAPDSLRLEIVSVDSRSISLGQPTPVELPSLRDQDGVLIRNQDGKTHLLGDGGNAAFITFNSDQGLALDFLQS